MKVLWFLIVLGLLFVSGEAKRKRKFEGDFEFADEDEPRNSKNGEKKRWIHDPNSNLCHPLNCKKKEICLLEDEFTAVCVSKKELHKNGDIVISKAKLLAEEEEARRKAALEDDEDDLDDEDDVFYDSDESPDDLSDSVLCKACPVIKPTFLCGTDNRTYSSLCRLDYHNCIHHTNIRVSCKGFCPCKEPDMHMRKKQRQAEHMANFMNKYKATLDKSDNKLPVGDKPNKDKYKFTPEDFKYENKHYKYIKYTKYNKDNYKFNNPTYAEDKERQRGYNEVLDTKVRGNTIDVNANACSPTSLQNMGNRLLDWFSVVMADTKRRRIHSKTKISHFTTNCKSEVRWMFQHLDTDADSNLSLQELFDLEHDKSEQCIKPFLEQCDGDHNERLSPREWCKCFDKADRPCAAVKRRSTTNNLLGAYVPDCDTQGYYMSTQCHGSIGMCWCVDKHGVEFANTRTRGKPSCETLLKKSNSIQKLESNVNDTIDDEDSDDTDESIEGSADQPLDF